ncbi:MAG: glycosyltransferase family 2 protein [Acidimicrobiia bacterium]|nr:glycosyltransferase family 2 protein [Acidimicrobiia bacterium]
MHPGDDTHPSGATAAPAVSVVIIFLDAERFLGEAIASVRMQDRGDWELLLVDDGSADGSTTIARQAAAADPDRVRYVEHPGHRNRGMSASRNAGAARARARWLAFLDSDDAWTPGHLSSLLALADRYPDAELIYGPGRLWFSWDPSATDADRLQPIGVDEVSMPEPGRLAERWIDDGNSTPCPSAVMVARDAFDRLGGFEESFRGLYEDQAFCFKAALGARVVMTPQSTLQYRQHAASCCSVNARAGTSAEARLRFLRWARDWARSRGPAGASVVPHINRQIFDLRRSTGVLGAAMRAARAVTPSMVREWLRAR